MTLNFTFTKKVAFRTSVLGVGLATAVIAAPSHAATFSGTVANLKVAGFTFNTGNAIYSSFGGFSNFNDTDQVQISGGGGSSTLTLQNSTGWSSPLLYSFSYTITATPAGSTITGYSTSSTSSITPPAPSGFSVLTPTTPASAFAQGNVNSGLGTATFTPATSNAIFLSQLFAANGKIVSFNNTIAIQNTNVPGPLPLLGAGAAFGFSRKLRRRVKAAA